MQTSTMQEGAARRAGRQGALAWLRLIRLARDMVRAEERHLHALGISTAELDVLAQIGAREGLTQQDLARRLLMTQGNVTYHLDRLARRDLVERRVAGRSNRLFLTESGLALNRQVVPAQEAWHAGQLAVLSADEQRTLLALLRKLARVYR
jgi:DNA-binding MarR family transcriptional regulator